MPEECATPDPAALKQRLTVVVAETRDIEPEMTLFASDAVWDMSQGGAEVIEGRAFHVRGGQVTRLVIYLERERALADLGLEE